MPTSISPEPIARALYMRQEIGRSVGRNGAALDGRGDWGVRGKVLRDNLVHGHVVASRIGDVDDAVDGVLRVAFTFAPHHGVPARGNEGLALNLHLLHPMP